MNVKVKFTKKQVYVNRLDNRIEGVRILLCAKNKSIPDPKSSNIFLGHSIFQISFTSCEPCCQKASLVEF